MSSARGARYLTLAGLSAVSAAAAHGGWSELTDPRWAAAAVVGAAIAALGVTWAGAVMSSARWAAAELTSGHVHGVGSPAYRPLTVAEAAVVLVTAQIFAHCALLLAGAPAHAGAAGTVALHLALALAAALVASAVDRGVGAALGALGDVLARLLELLAAPAPARNPGYRFHPLPGTAVRRPLGRAPPRAA
jgi:hypothetical protein